VADDSWSVRQAAGEQLARFDASALLPALDAALRDHENAGLRNAAMEIYVRLDGLAWSRWSGCSATRTRRCVTSRP